VLTVVLTYIAVGHKITLWNQVAVLSELFIQTFQQ